MIRKLKDHPMNLMIRQIDEAGARREAGRRIGVDGHHGWKSQDDNGQAAGAPAQF